MISKRNLHLKGFTLIELLIVVAIIAILAAIAVPNFLEAQTRSKVSRAKADMRSMRTALEAYAVDNNHYPPDRPLNKDMETWARLTTPVAFMSSVPMDPFIADVAYNGALPREIGYVFGGVYQINDSGVLFTTPTWGNMVAAGLKYWVLSNGPNRIDDFHAYDATYGDTTGAWLYLENPKTDSHTTDAFALLYDPTNGTVSRGDLLVSNKRLYN